MKRETAWRVFAGEYNDSSVEIKGDEEMSPLYVVTPLGAKVNRLFIIGVLTDVENVSEQGELVRAHISDPTGVFTLYSGQYQQDVTDALSNIEVPAFVAVIGKTRTYRPEEGAMYVSVRPEKIMEVNAPTRDRWILETCKNTKDRVEAIIEATKMTEKNIYELKKLGYSSELSEGIITALERYENIDLDKYVTLIHESLQYLIPGKKTLPDLKTDKKIDEEQEEKPAEEPVEEKEEEAKIQPETTTEKEEETDSEETEKTVLDTIKKLEGEDGAPWDSITEKCEKNGLDKDSIEEALSSLMDKGLIYEPVLGTIKTT
jgi:RPA family protein